MGSRCGFRRSNPSAANCSPLHQCIGTPPDANRRSAHQSCASRRTRTACTDSRSAECRSCRCSAAPCPRPACIPLAAHSGRRLPDGLHRPVLQLQGTRPGQTKTLQPLHLRRPFDDRDRYGTHDCPLRLRSRLCLLRPSRDDPRLAKKEDIEEGGTPPSGRECGGAGIRCCDSNIRRQTSDIRLREEAAGDYKKIKVWQLAHYLAFSVYEAKNSRRFENTA